MLPKRNRLPREILKVVFKEGRTVSGKHFLLKFIIAPPGGPPRISFIASKNVAKNASERNSLRRRGSDALEKNISKIPSGFLGVFIFKNSNLKVPELEDDIEEIVKKVH